MPAFIRYSFFGFVALALSACGSSGSSRSLESDSSTGEESESVVQELYPGVDYLITDIPAAVAKFAADTSTDPSDGEDTEEENQTATDTGAEASMETAARLNSQRNNILNISTRYLSTGAVLARTDNGAVVNERSNATCSDSTATGPTKCVFGSDSLREATTFHLGSASSTDNDTLVSFRGFMADRQPVMRYRQAEMSQVRTTLGTDEAAADDMETEEEAEDGRDNEYVGYDGMFMLGYSMFYVGVYRFFDEEGELQHARYENASLGRIYDENSLMDGVQSPSVALTGEGVMVGIESKKLTLEYHLVQGDVNINYDPFVAADAANNIEEMPAMIDISITNIQRLADDGAAWYANIPSALNWSNVTVTESEFSVEDDDNPIELDPGKLSGSFYGTERNPEVGGVFHHEDILYEIVGSFGSKLSEPTTTP